MQPVAWSRIAEGRCAITENGAVVIRKGNAAINVETGVDEHLCTTTPVFLPSSVRYIDDTIFKCLQLLASMQLSIHGQPAAMDARKIFDLCNDRLPPNRRGD